MDIQIKQGPQCHPSNCYTYRNGDIKYIVIHFTGNNGDTALNNCTFSVVRTVRRQQIILLVMTVFINLFPIIGRRGLSAVQIPTNTDIAVI